jgi:hypothetical protein
VIVPGVPDSLRLVLDFLSDEWLDAMAAAADRATADPGLSLVIQQVVVDGSTEHAWFVSADASRVYVGAGRHPSPSLTMTVDRATAWAVHSGAQSAQQAFMAGRLRIGGDVRVLLDQQSALASLDDVFAEVRQASCAGEPTTADVTAARGARS